MFSDALQVPPCLLTIIRMGKKKTLVVLTAVYFIWFLYLFFFAEQFPSLINWFKSTEHWDVLHFEKMWKGGYLGNHVNLGAAPGFAYLTGFISDVSGIHFTIIGGILSLLGFFIGSVCASLVLSEKLKVNYLWIFIWTLSMPAAFYAFIPYSDGLFFGLFWLFLWSLDQRPVAKYLLLLSMPFFRIVAFALLSWVVLRKYYVLILILPLSLWLLANQIVGGSPFYFQEVQKIFGMPEGHFGNGLRQALSSLNQTHDLNYWISFSVLPLLLLLLLFISGIWFWVKRERLLALTIFSILLMSHNQAFWRSVVRYDLVLYPFLGGMILNLAIRYRKAGYPVFLAFVVAGFYLQVSYSNLFHRGQWAF